MYSRRKAKRKEKKIEDVSKVKSSQECNEEELKYHHLENESYIKNRIIKKTYNLGPWVSLFDPSL